MLKGLIGIGFVVENISAASTAGEGNESAETV